MSAMQRTDEELARSRQRFDAMELSLTNHAPSDDQVKRIEDVRERAKLLGAAIIAASVDSRERSLALTHLEDTMMWAVKGIVLGPDSFD